MVSQFKSLIQRLFSRRAEVAAPTRSPLPQLPPPPRALEVIDPGPSSARFQIVRIENEVLYQAYEGDEGAEARRAWDAYLASDKTGEFWFLDSHHPAGHRGTFTR